MVSNRNLCEFTDILKERRETSDLVWASRTWEPAVAYIQPSKTSASQIKAQVLNSERIKYIIDEISNEEKIPREELYSKVKEILDEVGYSKDVPILRWLGLIVTKILKKLCSGILVNELNLMKVKSQMGETPMLFIPSHRSYGDFILMSYICFNYEVDIPRVAAGMDFHSMMIMGRVLRDACAFFMRRSFSNDKLYSAIFSQYVQTLITDGDAAVEFFIEGTRSRTNKSLTPKFGFLSMALKPFFTGQVPDIMIVPVTFSYDRTLEEVLFAYELLGVPKPKESTSGLLKAVNILNENYGHVYVDFGEPMSVKQYFGKSIDRSIHNTGSVYLQDLTGDESKHIVDLAHAVIKKQQQLTVITCFNVISLIINNFIISGKSNINMKDIVFDCTWLKTILENVGAFVSIGDDAESSCRDAVRVHKLLINVTNEDDVRLCSVHTSNKSVNVNSLKGHTLSNETMFTSIPLMMLQHYVNPCLHYFVNIAFVTMVTTSYYLTHLTKGDLYKKICFLRTVFSHEFVFYTKCETEEVEDAIDNCMKMNLIKLSDTGYYTVSTNLKLQQLLFNTFVPFITGFTTMAQTMSEEAQDYRSETEMMKSCQARVERKLNSGEMNHPYALSLDLYSNAVQSFTAMNALVKTKINGQLKYKKVDKDLNVIEDELSKMCNVVSSHVPTITSISISAKL